ncbi:hypothetical protein [Sphingomonas sp.]|uniref:hypothetical protein n=1 Tax=Sphingomonas sp. TaxID=28214 RepID=UPI003B3BDB85
MAAKSLAQTPADLSDLVGARGAGGETQLEARGYRNVMTNMVRDTKFSFWWSERRRQCVSVATSDGRYDAITVVPPANCDGGQEPTTPPAAHPSGERISLVCIGSGSGPAAQSTSGYRYNSKTRKFEPEFGTTMGRESFSSDLEIEIDGSLGRVRPQGKLVSPIHSGGTDGWWPIEGLMIAPDRITGQYRMNGMNKPRIDYDRNSRIIRVKAATDFVGRCEGDR